jgi:hypothetical protein
MSRFAVAASLIAGLVLAPNAAAEVETYLVVFDATWSASTHPTDFPGNPHFSGLVGGSHSDAVTFWEPDGLATEGIRRMAELGSKTVLIEEVEAAITAGTAGAVISGPGIGTSPDDVTMFIDVDDAFPLITITSMLAPSPDWFIGTSGLPLHDGADWVNDVTVDLLVWDAGTDSGTTYTSSNQATVPPDPISDITDEYPFFGTRVGTLRFIRQSVPVGDAPIASALQLSAARPNPARARASVTLSLPADASVVADIFDVTGRRIRRLAERTFASGEHAVTWDGRTDDARGATGIAPSGIYFFRLTVDSEIRTSRVTWLR